MTSLCLLSNLHSSFFVGGSAVVEAEGKKTRTETSAGTSNDYMSAGEEGQTKGRIRPVAGNEKAARMSGLRKCWSGLKLEGGGNAEAERLTRLAEEILCAIGLNGLLEGVIACAARGEHVARNQLCRAALHLGSEVYVVA